MRAVLAPHELTHVQFVLLASLWWLEDNERQHPTQAQLAAQAGIDPMMTSQVARKLEDRGLLERRIDRDDSRARQVRLTHAGRALLSVALADVEAADETHFGALEGRRRAFLDALATLDAHRGP
ncbi:MAG: MarR family winged helix-turn-helix transcriptional regulator [Solirubrobacteraceae bacterium]